MIMMDITLPGLEGASDDPLKDSTSVSVVVVILVEFDKYQILPDKEPLIK